MNARSKMRQAGVSLSGLVVVLAVVGVIAMVGMKVLPSVTEFMAVKKAIVTAKSAGGPSDIRKSFGNTATIENIESVTAKDLYIVKTENGHDIHVTYERRIHLFGPAYILLDFRTTTAPNGTVLQKPENQVQE
jgi:hypothetical protein